MNPLYRLATIGASALYIPGLYLRSAGDPRRRRRLQQRMGLGLPPVPDPGVEKTRRLWLQAVSVGEVRTAEKLLPHLRRLHPGLVTWLSSTTPAGLERAGVLCADGKTSENGGIQNSFPFPLDLPWIVDRVFDHLKPSAYGSVETEIWPGILSECRARSIPALLVNGSLSERSARRWKWMAPTVSEAFKAFRAACIQSESDAARLAELGMPREALVVTGNLKFDTDTAGLAGKREILKSRLGLPPSSALLVAGSTAAGEEKILLEAWKAIRREHPDTIMLIAPRQPKRFDQVHGLIKESGMDVVRVSAGNGGASSPVTPGGVILLDTLGDLEAAYGLSRIAYVGGSLVPRGGQNPIEPASQGVPVLFGPGMDNFREIADQLIGAGAAIEVDGAGSLARHVCRFIGSGEPRDTASNAARRFVQAHAGATSRTVQALQRLIPEIFS